MLPHIPGISLQPLLVRAVAYSISWLLLPLALHAMLLLASVCKVLHLKWFRKQPRADSPETRSTCHLRWSNLTVYGGWVLALGLCQAVHNPTSATWAVRPTPFLLLGFYAQCFLAGYDAWSFLAHR